MEKIKFYSIKGGGRLSSCVGMSLWLLEELKLNYEVIDVNIYNLENKSSEYLKINPNGKVPCIKDDLNIIWESTAINYYLCHKYNPSFMGRGSKDFGLTCQWTQWAANEVQPNINNIYRNALSPVENKNPEEVKKSKYKIINATFILDKALGEKDYILGSNFSLVDLNLASIFSIHTVLHTDLSSFPNFKRWLNECLKRESLKSLKKRELVI